jgi:hypothetical protein
LSHWFEDSPSPGGGGGGGAEEDDMFRMDDPFTQQMAAGACDRPLFGST